MIPVRLREGGLGIRDRTELRNSECGSFGSPAVLA